MRSSIPGKVINIAVAEHSYHIHIGKGILSDLPTLMAQLPRPDKLFIVTEPEVASHHLAKLQNALAAFHPIVISVPVSEQRKVMSSVEAICHQCIAAKASRQSMIVVLGGGVLGDITGFAAAMLFRGINFIQIPSTLLAQVDSSIGGKTGINTSHGKNLLGAFHHPALVVVDIDLLTTMPERHLRAGLAELAKSAIIRDYDFFLQLERNSKDLLTSDAELLAAVYSALKIKADIVIADERELGTRKLLNFGHTFGHALERVCDYDQTRLLHGEAVSLGMMTAINFSCQLQQCDANLPERMQALLTNLRLPTSLRDFSWFAASDDSITAAKLIAAIQYDKKRDQAGLSFVILQELGRAMVIGSTAMQGIDVNQVLSDVLVTTWGLQG